MTNPLITTIDPKQLTLADWLSIASSRGNAQTWGFYSWLETVDPSVSGGDNPLKRLIELAFHPVESSKNISLLTGLLQMSFELPYSR
jgi:hypothetical protein